MNSLLLLVSWSLGTATCRLRPHDFFLLGFPKERVCSNNRRTLTANLRLKSLLLALTNKLFGEITGNSVRRVNAFLQGGGGGGTCSECAVITCYGIHGVFGKIRVE